MQFCIARRCSQGAELCRRALSCIEGNRTAGLEDSEDLVAGDNLDLSHTVRVTEDLTNPAILSAHHSCVFYSVRLLLLRWCSTLLRELADLVNNLLRSGLQPRRRAAGVGDGGG
jgi:hypothetical protein